MRVAAIFDIHANLPALEAVLDDVRRERVDGLLVGGDLVPGPMPRETMECLRRCQLPVHLIAGNGERDVLDSRAGREPTRVPAAFRPIIHWTAEQLEADDEQWIAAWPLTIRLAIDGPGEVFFCHATPRDDNAIFTALTPEERLRPLFDALDVPLVVCGHTHMPFDRMVGTTRVVNAGSVGMPFGPSGADWLLLGPGVEFRHTSYDLEAAADRIRATSYPHARDFADTNVLSPPSASAMLEILTAASGLGGLPRRP